MDREVERKIYLKGNVRLLRKGYKVYIPLLFTFIVTFHSPDL